MINLNDYIQNKTEEMNDTIKKSRDFSYDAIEIVQNFLTEAFYNDDPVFIRYCDEQDLNDLAYTFGWDKKDLFHSDLMDWLKHGGTEYFEKVVREGIVDTERFEFYTAAQQAQVEEVCDIVRFVEDEKVIQPILAAMYLQSQGHEKANEDLLDRMAEKMDTTDLSPENMANILAETKKELGIADKTNIER